MLLALVAMTVCAKCHSEIVARYLARPMAHTSGMVDAASEPSGQFFHAASGTRFQILKFGKRLELDWNDHRQPLDFFIGSRRMGRSYGFIDDGYFYQAPVGYYANRQLWDMAPGYEKDHKPDFSRPITGDCLFCHASGAKPTPETINHYADTSFLQGVSCERCHGDPARHLANPQKGTIINPPNLPVAERNSICEQCHLAGEARFPQAGKKLIDFRAGDRLSTYLAVFVGKSERSGLRVNSHEEALRQSLCLRSSGDKLWCGTCHDPHGQTTDYRSKCLSCHEATACPIVAKQSPGQEEQQNCIGCHMPKTRAYDGGHSVFTDHSIPRRVPEYSATKQLPESLQSYYPVDSGSQVSARNWGVAWASVAETYGSSAALEKAWPLLRTAAASHPDDPLLYLKIGEALESAGAATMARKAYELALEEDPAQVDVLLRLAALLEKSGEQRKAAALRKRAAAVLPRLPQ